jgi:hypothetical protein
VAAATASQQRLTPEMPVNFFVDVVATNAESFHIAGLFICYSHT